MVEPHFHGRPSLFLDSVQKHGALMVMKIAEWDLRVLQQPLLAPNSPWTEQRQLAATEKSLAKNHRQILILAPTLVDV